MSEFSTFRVDPRLTTVENCRANVENEADIFVLIIGGRHGSIDPSAGKSIVNLEYEAAVAANLDVIVFVASAVLNLLPIWKANRNSSFEPVVDSTEVLSFVSRIQDEQRWTYPFAREADIFETLKTQISGQLRDLLRMRREGTFYALELFKQEGSEAGRLVRSKEIFWEYLLTAELLEQRLYKAHRELKHALSGRVLGPHRTLKGKAYLNWVQDKFSEITAAVQRSEYVITEEITSAWGAPGQQGDPAKILMAMNELGAIIDSMLAVESDVSRTHGPDSVEPVHSVMQGMTEELLVSLDDTVKQLREVVDIARKHSDEDGPLTLNVKTVFTFNRGKLFTAALRKMKDNVRFEDWED